jgi:hypothetical protein
MKSDEISNTAIFVSIFVTLFFGMVFSVLNYAPDHLEIFPLFPNVSAWFVTLVYFLCHPIIGKCFSVIGEILANANDAVYSFDDKKKWGDWKKESKLYFAATWPISAPVYLTFTLLALVYGILIKGLFR